jgi:bifunctional non-homologous end joining protein LigD
MGSVSAVSRRTRRANPNRKSSPNLKISRVGTGDEPPAFVVPQLATLVASPPRDEGWVHEIKFDGYRLLAILKSPDARLFTRAGNDWSARFAPLCGAFAALEVASAVIDGEAVHADAAGTFSFHALQDALSRGKFDHLQYYAFDLLHLNGVDLRPRPLLERKAILQEVLRGAPPILAFSQHFTQSGEEMLRHACSLGLEGIVSKQGDASYRSGRVGSWLKSKCVREQEFVIGGYTEQPKHPGVLGALLIGYYEKARLQFSGKVGTGFSVAEGTALLRKLKAIGTRASSFDAVPTDARRGARFVNPQLVAHIKFAEWTPDGRLRHPSFQGLREDKPAREVVREQPRGSRTAKGAGTKRRKRPQ